MGMFMRSRINFLLDYTLRDLPNIICSFSLNFHSSKFPKKQNIRSPSSHTCALCSVGWSFFSNAFSDCLLMFGKGVIMTATDHEPQHSSQLADYQAWPATHHTTL